MSDNSVYIVDDDEGVRLSLAALLRGAGYKVYEHVSAAGMLAALDAEDPGASTCAVIDVRVPGMEGLALQRQLAERSGARIPVIIVAGQTDVPLAVQAMRNGAVDFVEKPYQPDRMLAAVADAQAIVRAASLSPAPRRRRNDRDTEAALVRLAALTAREREVLGALVAGKSNKVIARDLGLSPRTVEAHRAALMERLSVKSLAEAIRLAVAGGMAA